MKYHVIDSDNNTIVKDTEGETIALAKQLDADGDPFVRVFEFQDGESVSQVEIYQSGIYAL